MRKARCILTIILILTSCLVSACSSNSGQHQVTTTVKHSPLPNITYRYFPCGKLTSHDFTHAGLPEMTLFHSGFNRYSAFCEYSDQMSDPVELVAENSNEPVEEWKINQHHFPGSICKSADARCNYTTVNIGAYHGLLVGNSQDPARSKVIYLYVEIAHNLNIELKLRYLDDTFSSTGDPDDTNSYAKADAAIQNLAITLTSQPLRTHHIVNYGPKNFDGTYYDCEKLTPSLFESLGMKAYRLRKVYDTDQPSTNYYRSACRYETAITEDMSEFTIGLGNYTLKEWKHYYTVGACKENSRICTFHEIRVKNNRAIELGVLRQSENQSYLFMALYVQLAQKKLGLQFDATGDSLPDTDSQDSPTDMLAKQMKIFIQLADTVII